MVVVMYFVTRPKMGLQVINKSCNSQQNGFDFYLQSILVFKNSF